MQPLNAGTICFGTGEDNLGFRQLITPIQTDDVAPLTGSQVNTAERDIPAASNNTKSYPCTHPNCAKSCKRQYDLIRHVNNKHTDKRRGLVCPINLCSRSIPHEGFDRMDHLVKHLVLGKHRMNRDEAQYAARLANPSPRD